MRKKRKMTKTTMVKKLFLFLAITAGLLTSCKDYDDDIDGLNEDIAALQTALGTANTDLSTLKTQIQAAATDNEVTAAVNAAKTEAVNQAKTQTEALIDALKGGSTKTIKALETDLTALTASLQALQVQVGTLATAAQLDAAKLDIAANKAAIALQQAVLDKYLLVSGTDNVVDKIAVIKKELTELQASTETEHAAMQAAIDAIEAKIVAIDAKLNVLNFAAVNSMITDISFVRDFWTNLLINQTLDYRTAISRVNYTFGEDSWASKVVFTKGSRLLAEEASLIVKVEPANADLSKLIEKGQIYLMSSDANTAVNNYIKATKAVRYTTLITRAAPTTTGLWEITFELPSNANLVELEKLVVANSRPVAFAVAVESTVDSSEGAEARFVTSEFGALVYVGEKLPVYNWRDYSADNDLTFSVKNGSEADAQYVHYSEIRNRYAFSETPGVVVPTDQMWTTGVYSTTGTPTSPDPTDNRLGKDLFSVVVNNPFNVKLNNPASVYAYRIELDREYAKESSPSEINAWDSYGCQGLDQVYKAADVASLKIPSSAANGDIIGFRVKAVNYDGTLVDPDGKSFYVIVGNPPVQNTLNFTATVTQPMTAGQTLTSDAPVYAPNLAGVDPSRSTFTMNLEHNAGLTIADLVPLAADGVTTTSWANVKRLQIANIIPAKLQENVPYTGTLTLKNASNQIIAIATITLTKVLPVFASQVEYKTNILRDGVIWAYPITSGAANVFNMQSAFNGVVTPMYFVDASSYSVKPTYNGYIAQVPTSIIGVPSLEDPAGSTPNIYDANLALNYGPVKYSATVAAGVNYETFWTETPSPIKVQFRSFVQDFVLNWKAKPALKYSVAGSTSAGTDIWNTPPAGAKTTLGTNPIATVDGNRKFRIVAAWALSGNNFASVNEYYIPSITESGSDPAYTYVINWNPNPQAARPNGTVVHKLALDIQDEWGNTYQIQVAETIDMTLN
ncbi:MAG: hypothetical protein AB2L20_04420 [Mangrovibacterium sp.]